MASKEYEALSPEDKALLSQAYEIKRRMKINYDEEIKLKEAKKELFATMKSLPSSSRKTKVSSSDPQK